MSTETLRVASIGVGGMSGTHAQLFNTNPRVELVCVCDIAEEKATQRGQELGCDAMTDYRDVLRRGDVDAVMVGVPNALHYPIALDCLRAGKHTAVEYPICQTVAQFDTLRQEADARSLVIADVLTPVIEPQALGMRRMARKIGRVMSMRSAYFSGGAGGWYVREDVRGNFYAALTIHQIIYFNVLLGETPDWVEGSLLEHRLAGGGQCASGMYMCHYPSGALAFNDWGMGFDVSPSVWEWVVEGTEGRLSYERPAGEPHRARVQRRGAEDEVLEMEPQSVVHPVAIENFLAQILDSAEPYASPETSREVIGICEAALRSAHEGRRVRL